jgi:formylglycine-generating enzyme required for sulfatase activity
LKINEEYAVEKVLANWAIKTWWFAIAGKEVQLFIHATNPIIKGADKLIEELPNTALLENESMVFIKGGWFNMGSKTGEKDECPIHTVWIDDFAIGKYPVTQKEWKQLMTHSPSKFRGNDLPVENISWNDIQKFIEKLNAKSGKKYRLPTEAEWEYAAKGGENYLYSGSNNINEVAWYISNSERRTHEVGQKKANNFGLYDMTGNVWEWCNDWYDENYYKNSPERNPRGSSDGTERVVRGGSWLDDAEGCWVSYRDFTDPIKGYSGIGFRIVQDL